MSHVEPIQQQSSSHFLAHWWRRIRPYLSTESWTAAAALIISFVAVFGLAAWLTFEKGDLGLKIFRVLMIVTFTILPAVMYYVFIATAKANLFQEFVSNLARLGLLHPHQEIADNQIIIRNQRYLNHMRVDSYLQRFEGVYGPVGDELEGELLIATNTDLQSDGQATTAVNESADRQSKAELHEPSPDKHRSGDGRQRGDARHDQHIRPVHLHHKRRAGFKIFSFATAIPVFLASLLIGLGWVQFIPPLAIETMTDDQSQLTSLASLHPDLPYNNLPALFAFLGAYFFALQMIYRRFMTNDLKSSIFSSLATRIVLAVIAACVLQAVLVRTSGSGHEPAMPDEWLLATAFVVGAFPPVIWRLLRNVLHLKTLLKGLVPRFQSDLPLSRLDGLTIWHQTRLEEEDIENVYNMADTHILSLMLNTKIPANRIIAWVDQAILLSCMNAVPKTVASGEEESVTTVVEALEKHGVRTASALVDFNLMREKLDEHWVSPIDPALLHSLARSVYSYPNLELILNWKRRLKLQRSGTFDLEVAMDQDETSSKRHEAV